MLTISQIKDAKRLNKEGKYEEIYQKYGSKVYKKYANKKYRKADLKNLEKEGKFEEIYSKYGKKKYVKVATRAEYNEIKYERGTMAAIGWKFGKKGKDFAKEMVLAAGALAVLLPPIANNLNKYTEKKDTIKYAKQIENYNKNLEEYVQEEFENKDYTDLEVIMKVMDDMWNSIEGYANPSINSANYPELALTENGYGVCRNFAADIAKKLNEINPEYNARTAYVFSQDPDNFEAPDIETRIITPNATTFVADSKDIADEENKKNEIKENLQNFGKSVKEVSGKVLSKVLGDHAVTFVDIKEDNITLVVDPTNCCLGVFSDGQITIFNVEGKDSKTCFNYKELTEFSGFNGKIKNVIQNYANSFKKPNLSFEELAKKYGVESQNKALEHVRKAEKDKNENKLEFTFEDELGNLVEDTLDMSQYESKEAKRISKDTIDRDI